MLVRKKNQRSWNPIAGEGIEFCELRQNGTNGGAGLVQLVKGARFPSHDHPGWEEALILCGAVTIGGNRLVEGDYLFTEAGEIHDAVAEEDTIFYVSSEKGIDIIENAEAVSEVT